MNKVQGRSVWVMAKGYTPDEGGMQTYARAVAETYAGLGASVTVFTQTSAGPRAGTIGPVRLVDIGAGRNVMVPIRMLRAVRAQLRHGRPDLVHATTWRTSILPLYLGLPYITTFHGREFMYVTALWRALMSRVARQAVRVVAVSQFTAQALARRVPGLPQAPVVAWNGVTAGITPREWQEGGQRLPRILSLCRFEARKNLRSAVEAAAACHREGLRFHFTMAGRGEEHARVSDLVARLGMQEVIDLPGFVDQQRALQLYREADIFIHPHITCDGERDFEGFGIAIADAMYAGAAVIAGRDGGARELLEDGVSGLGVDGRDQAAVTRALRTLLLDSARRRSMAMAGAARAACEFRWQRHVQTILDALPELPLR